MSSDNLGPGMLEVISLLGIPNAKMGTEICACLWMQMWPVLPTLLAPQEEPQSRLGCTTLCH